MRAEEEDLPVISPVGHSICRIEAPDDVRAHCLVDEHHAHSYVPVNVVVNESERGCMA